LSRLEQGTHDGLLEAFDRLSTKVPDLAFEVPIPLFLISAGELERARQVYDRIVERRTWETSDHMGTIASLLMLTECAARFDDPGTARAIYPILAPHAGEYAVVAGFAGLLSPVTHALGQLCGLIGRYDEATAYFERCIDDCRRSNLRTLLARTQLAWARVLARRNAPGDRRRAHTLGQEAQRRAEKLDVPLLVADAMTFTAGLSERTLRAV